MRSRPRVVIVMSCYQLGGAERQLAALVERRPAAMRDVDLQVITFLPTTAPAVARRFERAGVRTTLVDRRATGFPAFFFALLRTMRRLKPDLVLTVLDSSVGAWGRLAAWLARVPVIVHSDQSLMVEGTRAHLLLRPFLDRVTARFLPNARAIADRLVRDGVPPGRIAVVPTGVDLSVFDPVTAQGDRRAWGVPEGALVAGYLGRFAEVKRLDVLLDAVLLLPPDARPDYLVLAGDGPTMPEVRARVAADPWLTERCRLPGAVERVPEFLAGIDYLLLSSRIEGLPNAVLEAMAMARPVVATRVSDVPAIVEGSGFLAEPEDAASLAAAIGAMQALPADERLRLGLAGRARVERDFDLARVAERFWGEQLALLADARAGRRGAAAAKDGGAPPGAFPGAAPPGRRVALFLPVLVGGGAERVTLNLARGLRDLGYGVDLVVAVPGGSYAGQVPGGVALVPLGARRTLTALPALVRYLRRSRPDALLSALDHANVVALWAARLARYRGRVLVAEHNDPRTDGSATAAQRLFRRLVRGCYPWADRVIAVSEGVKEGLVERVGIAPASIEVIYNPVITPEMLQAAGRPAEHPCFAHPPVVVAVGRLTRQKNFANLLRAFALVQRRTDARLIVLGEGEERGPLEALVRALGLTGSVAMPGFVADPYAYLARADLFVLSSDWEGLPTVLIEALALGTRVVATDCRSGPREILAGGAYGALVPVGDSGALADAIVAALEGARAASGAAGGGVAGAGAGGTGRVGAGAPAAALARFTLEGAGRAYAAALGLDAAAPVARPAERAGVEPGPGGEATPA